MLLIIKLVEHKKYNICPYNCHAIDVYSIVGLKPVTGRNVYSHLAPSAITDNGVLCVFGVPFKRQKYISK